MCHSERMCNLRNQGKKKYQRLVTFSDQTNKSSWFDSMAILCSRGFSAFGGPVAETKHPDTGWHISTPGSSEVSLHPPQIRDTQK